MNKLLLIGVLALLDPFPAAAQPPDSARILRAARSEQARFEAIRRRHLPWTWSGSGGSCDERIGRFCLTHNDDDDSDDWRPPPEPEPVQRARAALLVRLDSAAARVPADGWIAGQRVRYHLEAGDSASAARAAAECRAARWWCLALGGYTQHAGGNFVAADSLFRDALSAMPDKERREWNDLSVVLGDGDWRAYRRAGGGYAGFARAAALVAGGPAVDGPGE